MLLFILLLSALLWFSPNVLAVLDNLALETPQAVEVPKSWEERLPDIWSKAIDLANKKLDAGAETVENYLDKQNHASDHQALDENFVGAMRIVAFLVLVAGSSLLFHP
ncbi:MAG: hypothetical protein R2880_12180 [Deinococcales bacterium]